MADLELREISKSFGPVTALKNISLTVDDGEFAILLGPSGCGKSTLLRIIAGLEAQSRGEVWIGKNRVDSRSPRDRDIAMVFQSYALYPHLTVRENLAFGLKMRKAPKAMIEERIREAAQLLEIQNLLDRKPRELSGGQRQRVAMGRAIVRKPKLFLFDEPLSNLDAKLRVQMRVELKQLHQRLGTTMIYVTHDQVEAMTLGQKIVVLDRGEVRQIDPPDRIYGAPADTFVAGFIGSPPMNLLDGTIQRRDSTWRFESEGLGLDLPVAPVGTPLDPGHPAALGIRPEDIALDRPAGRGIPLRGTVDVLEDLGADRLAHLKADGWRLIIRLPRAAPIRQGQHVDFFLPADRLHLFSNGRRLEIRPAS